MQLGNHARGVEDGPAAAATDAGLAFVRNPIDGRYVHVFT